MFNFFSEPLTVWFPLTKSQMKTQHLQTSIELKIIVSLACISVLIVREFLRKHLDCFSIFKFIFHQINKLHLFFQGRHRNFLHLENLLMRELSICVPCISVLTVPNFRKVLYFSFAQYSNLYSSVITSLNSSTRNSVQNIAHAEEYWGEKPMTMFVASRSR